MGLLQEDFGYFGLPSEMLKISKVKTTQISRKCQRRSELALDRYKIRSQLFHLLGIAFFPIAKIENCYSRKIPN